MFFIPMAFMLVVTITSLIFTIKSNFTAIIAGGTGLGWCYIRAIFATLLVILAIVLTIEGINTIKKQFKNKATQS